MKILASTTYQNRSIVPWHNMINFRVLWSNKTDPRTDINYFQLTEIHPYDEAEYYWALYEGGSWIRIIYNGQTKQRIATTPYADVEDDYEDQNDYVDQVIDSVMYELYHLNKDIKPRIDHT